MKICNSCKSEKPYSEFHKRPSSKDGYRYECKECVKRQNKRYYQGHRGRCDQLAKARCERARYKNKLFIIEYLKNHSCIDCGNNNPVVLDFDHVRGRKRKTVPQMLTYSRESILSEIAKCDVRCANCHRIRHATEKNWMRGN